MEISEKNRNILLKKFSSIFSRSIINLQTNKKKIKNSQNSLAYNAKRTFLFSYHTRIIEVRKVTKILKSGKAIRFRAVVAIGNKKNQVGVGVGKGQNVLAAVEKANLSAKYSLIKVAIAKNYSIHSRVEASYGASKVMLFPAPKEFGIVAGSSTKAILELSGIQNVFSLQLGSSNCLNNAIATIKALQLLSKNIWLNSACSYKRLKAYFKNLLII
jgi:small subunit ribosomal protein S5